MDAEDMLLRQFVGVREPAETEATAAWIRSQQREDGSWGNFFGAPGDLSTTAESYLALRLAGDPAEAEHMRRAAAFVRERGGLERARVFTHIWMALFGLWPWERVPALPPEIMLLPPWVPLNVYDFACWARQTIVALTIVSHHRPVRPLPDGVGVEELKTGAPPQPPRSLATWAGRFERLDRALQVFQRHPIPGLRALALARAEAFVVRRQEADGGWGGIQPPWVYSIMALDLQGYPLDHPVMRRAFEGLDGFLIEDERGRRLEACQSPVWDTALATVALADSGPRDHPALVRAADWLLDEEIRVAGDWAVRRPRLAPGGWAFEFENDNYPDIDDTAEVILALRRVEHPDPGRVEGAVRRAIDWTLGMQSRDGGWGAFDADNTRALCYEIPFCDFGAVIDDPSADVTAHVVEMLAGEGMAGEERARRAREWLRSEQERSGSWFGRWGVNHVYGVGAVVPALIDAGVPAEDPGIQRALAWLRERQNEDGGWGEDCRSYVDEQWIGRGESTASQTAWALLALIAAGEASCEAAARGVAWLVATQRADGGWDEPYYTGTGFPGDFYINYHLYRLVFPVTALGRWLRAT